MKRVELKSTKKYKNFTIKAYKIETYCFGKYYLNFAYKVEKMVFNYEKRKYMPREVKIGTYKDLLAFFNKI